MNPTIEKIEKKFDEKFVQETGILEGSDGKIVDKKEKFILCHPNTIKSFYRSKITKIVEGIPSTEILKCPECGFFSNNHKLFDSKLKVNDFKYNIKRKLYEG